MVRYFIIEAQEIGEAKRGQCIEGCEKIWMSDVDVGRNDTMLDWIFDSIRVNPTGFTEVMGLDRKNKLLHTYYGTFDLRYAEQVGKLGIESYRNYKDDDVTDVDSTNLKFFGEKYLLFLDDQGNKMVRNIDYKTSTGENLFTYVARFGDTASGLILLNMGFNVNEVNEKGNTALHISSERGYGKFVEMLLENAIDIDKQNNNGETAIMLASKADREGIVDLLSSKGANSLIKDNEGRSLFDMDLSSGVLTILGAALLTASVAVAAGWLFGADPEAFLALPSGAEIAGYLPSGAEIAGYLPSTASEVSASAGKELTLWVQQNPSYIDQVRSVIGDLVSGSSYFTGIFSYVGSYMPSTAGFLQYLPTFVSLYRLKNYIPGFGQTYEPGLIPIAQS